MMGGEITIHTIEGWDFLAFPHFKLDVRAAGLVFLEGQYSHAAFDSNSCGKTSLLSALPWTIWQQLLKDVKDVNQVIRRGARNCRVVVTGQAGSQPFELERRRTRTTTEVLWNLGGSSRKPNIQTELNQTFQSFQLSQHSVFLGQQQAALFLSGGAAERRQVMEDMLYLSRYRVGLTAVEADIKEFRGMQQQLQGLVQRYEQEIDQGCQVAELQMRVVQASNAATMEQLRRQIEELDTTIATVQAQLTAAEAERQALQDAVLSMQLEPLRDLYQRLKHQHDTSLYVYRTRQSSLQMLLSEKTCRHCGSAISADNPMVLELQQQIQQIEKEMAPVILQYREVLARYEAGQNWLQYNIQQRTLCSSKIGQYGDQLNQHRKERQRLQQEHDDLGKSMQWQQTCPAWEETRPLLVAKQQHVDVLTDLLTDVATMLGQLERVRDGFHRRIPAQTVEDALPALSSYSDRYLSAITDQHYSFSLEPGSANARSLDHVVYKVRKDNMEIPWQETSAGTLRRLVVSLFLAVADAQADFTTVRWNCRFIDELFDVLDRTGIERVMRVLKDLVRTRIPTLVVASQRTELRDLDVWDQNWTVHHDGVDSRLTCTATR